MVSLSPSGDYLAATVPLDDRTALAVVRLSDMSISAQVDPGKDAFVDDALWVSDRRLLAQWSKRVPGHAQPYDGRSLYALDVDGRNRRHFYGSIVSPLLAEPDHVLIRICARQVREGCRTRLQRVRTNGAGKAEDVVDGPIANAWFTVDRTGAPRFSGVHDDDDIQRLFQYRGGEWVELNDEATSGIEVNPVGTSYDGKYGYLWSERHEGPDVIERIDIASGDRTVVASDPVLDPLSLVWSFDGSEPIGAAFGVAAPEVRYFDPSHPHVALSRELGGAFPDEFARVTSTSRDGRLAIITVTSDREPGRYYLLDIRSGDMKLLASSRPWIDRDALAPSRPFEIQGRDGTPLPGYLTLPLAAGPDAPAPLVVLPHGGPYGVRDAWAFDEETQLLAAEGYAVLRVNFRGSAGRGRASLERGYRQWGRAMQDDLTDATRWASKQPGVAGGRACIWGASYGGYAALMGTIREPDLYQCAIGMAGPYDLPTMFRWGDIQRSEWGEGYLDRVLGTDRKALLADSPSHHAAKIKAGLLLVQGGLDRRVSPQHLRILRKALDAEGKPYETYLPPEEGHGFHAEASRRVYYKRVIDFLARHLKSGS